MANSRNSKPGKAKTPLERVAVALKSVVHRGNRLAIGLSGGVDSVVLLDILTRLARRLHFSLSAIHVNHQLSPHAAEWSRFCRALCRERGIPIHVAKVSIQYGDSIEAAAREARQAVFAKVDADLVVLAHNQDDQVETLLLQLLRGAGVRGLAAMPVVGDLHAVPGPGMAGMVYSSRAPKAQRSRKHTDPPKILRPLLDVPRSEVETYARRRRLSWVEDESNKETYFLRNFLRHEVLPVIASRCPAYRTTLSRSSRHFAEAAHLLDELAAVDATAFVAERTLAVASLRQLTRARGKNLLRYFIALHGINMPDADRLESAVHQLITAKEDARVLIELDGAQLRRFQGRVHITQRTVRAPRAATRWHGERELSLSDFGGVLRFSKGREVGIDPARIEGRALTVRVRQGGERWQPHCDRPRRTLKNLLQEAGIPPWQREITPLLYCDDQLIWAAGIGVDCAYQSAPGESAICPSWHPAAP
jgi:tRNA(Ile)-lysidine synthase